MNSELAPTSPKPVSFARTLLGVASANLLPALGLQCVALFLLWSYHFWPSGRAALEQLAQIKQNSGLIFAFVASVMAGAILPLMLQPFQRGNHRRVATGALPVLILFWGLRGCFVDYFYQFQALLWGTGTSPQTLAIKVFCDLGIASPFLLVPSVTLIFAWVDNRHDAEFRRTFLQRNFAGGIVSWWKQEVWPLVPMAWVVWLPALVVIYALPTSLQFPTSALIQCFWVLFLVVLTDKGQNKSQAATDTA